MEYIRAFIANELPEEVKRTLTRLQERLKSSSRAPVRWSNPDGMHLTLKFLGNINSGTTGGIAAAMAEAVRGIRPFHLQVDGLGVFPSPSRVRVVWVGLTGETDKLERIQKNLDSKLTPLGFMPEARPFTPHLTLGRVREQARPEERQSLGKLVSGTPVAKEGSIEVRYIHLIRSQLRPEGPIYTRLNSVEMK
jgi:2'-5' RNA ligase